MTEECPDCRGRGWSIGKKRIRVPCVRCKETGEVVSTSKAELRNEIVKLLDHACQVECSLVAEYGDNIQAAQDELRAGYAETEKLLLDLLEKI